MNFIVWVNLIVIPDKRSGGYGCSLSDSLNDIMKCEWLEYFTIRSLDFRQFLKESSSLECSERLFRTFSPTCLIFFESSQVNFIMFFEFSQRTLLSEFWILSVYVHASLDSFQIPVITMIKFPLHLKVLTSESSFNLKSSSNLSPRMTTQLSLLTQSLHYNAAKIAGKDHRGQLQQTARNSREKDVGLRYLSPGKGPGSSFKHPSTRNIILQ